MTNERGTRKGVSERERHWRGVCAEFEASGLTAQAFGAERGIKHDTLKWWQRRFRRETGSGAIPNAGFIEVSLPEVQAEYILRFKNSRELVLRGYYSTERVKQLVSILESI